MADIRINALATTATASASDDYIAIDGAANGTRKLSAYSPTFGGNLTVSGTGTQQIGGAGALVKIGTPTYAANTNLSGNLLQVKSAAGWAYLTMGNGDSADKNSYIGAASTLLTFGSVTDAGVLTEYGRFSNGSGNLLIGTTTDGSGRLQVQTASSTISTGTGTNPVASNLRLSTSDSYAANVGPVLTFAAKQSGGGIYDLAGIAGKAQSDGNGYLQFSVYQNGASWVEAGRFANSGNLLLKSDGVDSSNGKLQLATHTTSAGGIGFGTSTSLFTDTARLVLVGGTTTRFRLLSTSGNAADLSFDNTDFSIGNSSSITLYTTGGISLVLDSSRNATFSGTIKPQQAATASAPTYVKGAIYFDTTLNKLRVGGAIGWETITSV